MRRLFNGTGPYPWIGLAFTVVAGALLASVLLSPNGWQWWMDANPVHGTEQDGIVSYSYHGTNYSIDDSGSSRTGPRTVYVIASDPGDAGLNANPAALDWATVGGPLLVGAAFVTTGFIYRRRNSQRRRRVAMNPPETTFGEGIDSETVRRLIAQRNKDSQMKLGPVTNAPDPPPG